MSAAAITTRCWRRLSNSARHPLSTPAHARGQTSFRFTPRLDHIEIDIFDSAKAFLFLTAAAAFLLIRYVPETRTSD
jgi:hypothetical protein